MKALYAPDALAQREHHHSVLHNTCSRIGQQRRQVWQGASKAACEAMPLFEAGDHRT